MFLRDVDTDTPGEQQVLSIAHCWAFSEQAGLGFVFLVFFWVSEFGFGFTFSVYTKIPMSIPCLRLSATLHLEIMWKLLPPSFGQDYGQARLHDESLVK